MRSDLLQLGARTFDTSGGVYGEVALQLRADARRFAEVCDFAEPSREVMVQQGRGVVRRAIERGDLPAAANPGMIMDLLIGGIISHIVATPRRLRGTMVGAGPDFIRTTVDLILAGVHDMGRTET